MTSRKVSIDIGDVEDQIKGEKEDKSSTNQVMLLNFNISHLSLFGQFLTMSLAVFVFYVVSHCQIHTFGNKPKFFWILLRFCKLYGLAMERIFLLPGLKKEGLYLTFVQFITYTTVSGKIGFM